MKTATHRLSRRRPIVPRPARTSHASEIRALLLKGKTPKEILAIVPVTSGAVSYHRIRLGLPKFPRLSNNKLISTHGFKVRITRSFPAWFLKEMIKEAKALGVDHNRLIELAYVFWKQETGQMSTQFRINTLERLQQALDVAYAQIDRKR